MHRQNRNILFHFQRDSIYFTFLAYSIFYKKETKNQAQMQ